MERLKHWKLKNLHSMIEPKCHLFPFILCYKMRKTIQKLKASFTSTLSYLIIDSTGNCFQLDSRKSHWLSIKGNKKHGILQNFMSNWTKEKHDRVKYQALLGSWDGGKVKVITEFWSKISKFILLTHLHKVHSSSREVIKNLAFAKNRKINKN